MPTPRATGTFARTTIAAVMAVIAALAFVFSFGNVWALARRLGVPHPIAPLIAPMVDLSVVGLLIALHHLAATGTDLAQLRPATRLMHLCGLLTLALNTAEPLIAGHYGRAALDTVAPALLLGWGAVGPTLLRHLHAPAATSSAETPVAGPAPTGTRIEPLPKPTQVADDEHTQPLASFADAPPVESKPAAPRKRSGRKPAASMDELVELVRPAVAEQGATHAVLKEAVRGSGIPISNDRIGQLLALMKDP
jgi:hypothetical protein